MLLKLSSVLTYLSCILTPFSTAVAHAAFRPALMHRRALHNSQRISLMYVYLGVNDESLSRLPKLFHQ